MARSAARTSVSVSCASSLETATPTLAPTSSSASATITGLARMSRIRSATRVAAAGSASSSSSTANSSPPSRATVSEGRRTLPMRRPTSISTSSPWLWPRLSLIPLKPSTSTNRTPIDGRSPVRPRRASAWAMRSNSSARLGRPVSESWKARWLSSWRLWRSRVAIALKESATWLSSLNESSSTRWARSPLPSRRAERLSVSERSPDRPDQPACDEQRDDQRAREREQDPGQQRALPRAIPALLGAHRPRRRHR